MKSVGGVHRTAFQVSNMGVDGTIGPSLEMIRSIASAQLDSSGDGTHLVESTSITAAQPDRKKYSAALRAGLDARKKYSARFALVCRPSTPGTARHAPHAMRSRPRPAGRPAGPCGSTEIDAHNHSEHRFRPLLMTPRGAPRAAALLCMACGASRAPARSAPGNIWGLQTSAPLRAEIPVH